MTNDSQLLKVEILFKQKKYKEAETILSDLLQEDPNNIHFLSVLAEVYLQQDKFDKANNIIDNAIGLSPDTAYLFYIKSNIAVQQEKYTDAEAIINQAIALDPYNADFFALLADIKLVKKQFNEALEIADKGLAIDAENILALNARSAALNKLNRSEEAFDTIESTLKEDPNNPYTHANYGWGLLEKGDHKKALQHFKEALTHDPDYEYAQAGMLEALKATNPIYRIFLKYSFWIGNLTAKFQWVFIIGFYAGLRLLNTIARNNEAFRPYLIPLIVLLAIVAFSTWIINPISNLFLRFNKYGQLLLSKREKISSNYVAVSLIVFLIGVLLYFTLSDEKMLAIAVFGFAMMLPLGTMFSASKNKYTLIIYTITLAIVGLIAIGLIFSTGEMFNPLTSIFILGFVAFQWVANYILIKEGNH